MNPRLQGFSRCWDFHDSSLRRPWMEIEWQFKIAVSTSRSGMFSAFADVYGCWIGQETRNGARMRPAVVEKIENQGRCTWERKGAGDSKSPSPMRAAECFRPLPVIKDVESVRKHETGLERGQWLLRKQRFTVLVHSTGEEGPDWKCKVQFTRRSIFGLLRRWFMSNRSGNTKRGSKGVSGCWENWDLLCLRSPPPILSHLTVILNFLGNRWSHSSPVSIFQTDSTPLIACKGRKPSAAWIRDLDFRGRSILVMLSIFTAIFDYLSNSKSFSSSV
jgi:hypothetical protein